MHAKGEVWDEKEKEEEEEEGGGEMARGDPASLLAENGEGDTHRDSPTKFIMFGKLLTHP